MYKRLLLIAVVLVFVISCQSDGSKQQGTKSTNTEDLTVPDEVVDDSPELSPDALDGIIQSFTNPIEMAASVKDLGVAFSLDYLCPTDKFGDLNLDTHKALGLGLLSADLGYLNIYEKTSPIISYITVIKRLADDLKIGQFFDFQTLKDLASSNDNLDRLMLESVNSFNQMDNHLREYGRSNLSILMITGVWVEGQYLVTQVYKQTKNAAIGEKIGEQKIILNDILAVLKTFKSDKYISSVINDLEQFKTAYEDVQITYEVGEPETIENKDGTITIIQNTRSIVSITPEQLTEISNLSEKIRNRQINL